MTAIYAIIRDAITRELRFIQEDIKISDTVTDYQLSQGFDYAVSLSDAYCSSLPNIPVQKVAGTRTLRKEAYAMICTIKHIQDKYDVIAISHRYGGFTHFDWNFGDNVTFHIYTNFGFGRKSDFNSTFRYKNIVLAPYSYYVKYRYSTYASVVSCTNAYKLDYSQWYIVMKDCLDFYNAVVMGKDNYIFNWLNSQLSQMVSGLEEFVDKYSYSLGEEFANNHVSSYTSLSGDDFWVVKSKKICNSLQFVENIKVLPVQVDSKKYIQRLENLCNNFKPKLENKIAETNIQIEETQQYLDILMSNEDYQLYSILKDKYYYSKGWYNDHFRMCWFLLHLLKRFEPDYKLEEIKSRLATLKEHIAKTNEVSVQLSRLKNLHSSLNGDLSKMNDYIESLREK